MEMLWKFNGKRMENEWKMNGMPILNLAGLENPPGVELSKPEAMLTLVMICFLLSVIMSHQVDNLLIY